MFAETVRRHFTSIGYWMIVVLIAMAAMFASTFNTPGALWPSLVTLLSIITGSALIGPELSTGTLQLIVSKPITRPVYLTSRAAGVFASIGLAAALGLAAEMGARLLLRPAAMPWQRLVGSFIGALAVSLLTITLLALLGSLTRAYFNVAIYLGVQVALSAAEGVLGLVRTRGHLVGTFLQQHHEIETGLAAVIDALFPAMPAELGGLWLLRIVATALLALALACAAFQRREIQYAAD